MISDIKLFHMLVCCLYILLNMSIHRLFAHFKNKLYFAVELFESLIYSGMNLLGSWLWWLMPSQHSGSIEARVSGVKG